MKYWSVTLIRIKRNIIFISAFTFLVVAMFCSTRFEEQKITIVPHYLCLLASMFLLFLGNECLIKEKRSDLISQMTVVGLIGTIGCTMLLVCGGDELYEANRSVYYVSFIFMIMASASITIRGSVFSLVREKKGIRLNEFLCTFVRHKWIVILLISIGILICAQSGAEPKWDGAQAYAGVASLSLPSLFNLWSLRICGHITMAYGAINGAFGIVLKNHYLLGMFVANLTLMLGSTAAVYGIVRQLFNEKSDLECTGLTMIYAIYPFVFGVSDYFIWDYWVTMLFPIVIYFAITNQWIYHLIFAIIMCFTKEPAIIAYALYALGILLMDILAQKEKKLSNVFINVVMSGKYWGMLSVGIAWLYTYFKFPMWGGDGSFFPIL